MAKGEIVIDETLCKGCGFCTRFCVRGCIEVDNGKIGPRGYTLATIVHPEKCNACAVCGWMCPDYAISVYRCSGDAQ